MVQLLRIRLCRVLIKICAEICFECVLFLESIKTEEMQLQISPGVRRFFLFLILGIDT